MDVRDLVDPEYRALVEQMAANPTDWSDPPKVREQRRQLAPPAPIPDTVDWADHQAPGPEGAPPVPVRVYRPDGSPLLGRWAGRPVARVWKTPGG